MTADELRSIIAAGLACDHIEVEGDGRHFFATIVSPNSRASAAIARHQRVYARARRAACARRSTRCR